MDDRKNSNGAPKVAKKPRGRRGWFQIEMKDPFWRDVFPRIIETRKDPMHPKDPISAFQVLVNMVLGIGSLSLKKDRDEALNRAWKFFFDYTVACKWSARAADGIVEQEFGRANARRKSPVQQTSISALGLPPRSPSVAPCTGCKESPRCALEFSNGWSLWRPSWGEAKKDRRAPPITLNPRTLDLPRRIRAQPSGESIYLHAFVCGVPVQA
jgi:hypothetical protein